jgi:hypothetical protein
MQVRDLRDRSVVQLAGLAAISWAAYLAIVLSAQSLHEAGSGRHSLLVLLALFCVAFVCYLAAIRVALRAAQTRRLLALIVTTAILFRVTLLFSRTIEEIDLYRYLWDGAVSTQGVNPFRYAPQQVLAATDDGSLPDDLARLVRLRDDSPDMTAILKRVHFGELPTIYPPGSQAVFALSAWLTPPGTSVYTRMVLMKAWFVIFDLATMLLVIRLLALAGRPPGMVLIYAWCPLLIKEIANSGHLDALAFFLTTWAAYLTVQVLYVPNRVGSPQRTAVIGAALLGLAVGAKLYPVVLAPLMAVSLLRRFGWRFTVATVLVFGLVSALLLWPMRPTASPASSDVQVAFDPGQVAVLPDDTPPAPPQEVSYDPRDPSQSLRAFLGEWEMNDFLFLIIVENLRPTDGVAPNETAWFTIVPEKVREQLTAWGSAHLPAEQRQAPFLLARLITSLCYLGIAGVLAWRGARAETVSDWLNTAFLTVAWFWLLLPTQNPWYWTWALPFLPFARSRAWLAMSGLALVYYVRFWLMRYFPEASVTGTGYTGPMFFDYVVVWLEFCPWFVWLLCENFRNSCHDLRRRNIIDCCPHAGDLHRS